MTTKDLDELALLLGGGMSARSSAALPKREQSPTVTVAGFGELRHLFAGTEKAVPVAPAHDRTDMRERGGNDADGAEPLRHDHVHALYRVGHR